MTKKAVKIVQLKYLPPLLFFIVLSLIELSACDNWTPVIPKVYVINMDKSTDRLEKISQEFSREVLGFERFKAVDGSKFDIVQLERDETYLYSPDRNYPRMTNGEFGNYFSHLKVLKQVVKDNALAIVVEDDIILTNGFLGKFQEVIRTAPTDWDLIFLGTYSLQLYPLINGRGFFPWDDGLELIDAQRHTGTYGYVVSPAGAKKLVDNMLPVVLPTDLKWQSDFVEQKHGPFSVFCVNPPIILHCDEQDSLIKNMGREH